MDDINALLGMGISDEEQLRALADSLRGQKRAADFFSLTSIPQIQKAAQAEQQQVAGAAERAGILKNALEQRRFLGEQGDLNRANALQRALIAASGRGTGTGGAKAQWGGMASTSERTKFRNDAKAIGQIEMLADSWKDEYGPSVQIPGVGTLENLGGRYLPNSLVGENLSEQALWWSEWEEKHNLIKRHDYFGSAFTKTEQEAWGKAFFNENTKPELIRAKLQITRALANVLGMETVIQAYTEGVSPNLLESYYGKYVDVPRAIDMWENRRDEYYQWRDERNANMSDLMGQLETARSAEAPKEQKPPNMTDEQWQRLQELRAKTAAG